MATTPTVTAWDEQGKPVPASKSAAAWDEKGNPIPAATAKPPLKDSYLNQIVTGPSLAGMEAGLPSPAAQSPENAESMALGAAIGAPIEGLALGGARALPAIGRSVLGAYGGSYLGERGGEALGGVFGPEGRDVGGRIGAGLGGLTGGYMGLRGMKVPSSKGSLIESLFGDKAPLAVKPTPPDPFAGATSSANPPMGAKLPPVPPTAPTPFPTVQPKTSLAVKPQTPSTSMYPEPRTPLPSDRPGSMWSVERETLPSRAQRGQPGAGEVLQNIGDKPVLYSPKPSIGTPDPEFEALRGRQSLFDLGEYQGATGSQIVPEKPLSASAPGVPQGSPTPFSQLPGYQPSEKAATMAAPRTSLGPEFEAQQGQEQINRYKAIQRNPKATPEDLAEASARLKELGAI